MLVLIQHELLCQIILVTKCLWYLVTTGTLIYNAFGYNRLSLLVCWPLLES